MERKLKHPILISIDKVQAKFKSKLDMYTVMSFDSKYIAIILSNRLFPFPIDKCPVAYLKAIISGEKKVIKYTKATKACIPKYKELSTNTIWNFVKEVPDLCIYFPDYTEKQYPNKDYLFSILRALCGEQLIHLVQEARRKRFIHEFVEVNEEIIKEFQEVFTQKSNYKRKGLLYVKERSEAQAILQIPNSICYKFRNIKKSERDKNDESSFQHIPKREGNISVEMKPEKK